jgi:hypothetical protein
LSSGFLQSAAQVKPGDPYESRGVVVVSTEEPIMTQTDPTFSPPPAPAVPRPTSAPKAIAGAPLLTATQLKQRIEAAVPAVRNVRVTFTGKTDVRVECIPSAGVDSGAIAGQILSLREFDPYKVDLHLQLPMSDLK